MSIRPSLNYNSNTRPFSAALGGAPMFGNEQRRRAAGANSGENGLASGTKTIFMQNAETENYVGGYPNPSTTNTAPNALRAVNPASANAHELYRYLEIELDRTRRHLAEVIDEVVFAEKCKADAEEKLASHQSETEAIELILQDMIGYIIAIESSVIVPALDDVTEAIPSGTVAERARLFSDLEKIHNVSPRTIRLIASMKNPSESRRERFRQRRDQLMRQGSRAPVSLDDAYALCALLLDAKEELQLLLGESRDRANKLLTATNRSGGESGKSSAVITIAAPHQSLDPETQQLIDDLRRQVEGVRLELEGSRKEKDMLNKRLNELSASAAQPYEKLQEQHYREKDRLQLQVRSLQESEKSTAEKYQYLNGKLEVLSETTAQLREEKRLLQNELKKYRQNESVVADAKRITALEHQHKQSVEDAHRLRLELDAMVRDHTNTVARLEAQNSHLRLELAEAKQAASRPPTVANNEHFAQLQRTNDLLRKDLVILQQRLLSSAGRVTDTASSAGFDSKIEAFEMTISSLNRELQGLAHKIKCQEEAFAEERAALVGDTERERVKFQQDKEDYDTLMQRMVDEMEKIVEENQQLKERILSIASGR